MQFELDAAWPQVGRWAWTQSVQGAVATWSSDQYAILVMILTRIVDQVAIAPLY